MSATNRGTKREVSDFYATPLSVVENFLHNYKVKPGNILEPTSGNGNIIKAIREHGYDNHITAIELRDEYSNLKNNGTSEVYIEDFLNYMPNRNYSTIISNPPYSIAQKIIEKCFEISDKNTETIMLLRAAFLESKKRFEFWQKHPVNGLYVLRDRPRFKGKGTDATAYAWFIWNGSNKQEIKVI
jgi:hypothetical protein